MMWSSMACGFVIYARWSFLVVTTKLMSGAEALVRNLHASRMLVSLFARCFLHPP